VELLYQLGLAAALLLAGPFLLLARGTHYLSTLRGRLAWTTPSGPRGALWMHAVSVGEVAVAAVLARSLPSRVPLLVTTITPTGQQRARAMVGERAAVGYLPIDLGRPVERFLRRLDPAALVLVEGDYWPLLLARCRRRGMPIVVVNGRVGDRGFARMRRAPRIARWLLASVDRFAVQAREDARRLEALGVSPDRITVAGNLKYEASDPPAQPALDCALGALAAGRPLLVAGSTMPGEEEAVLAAFAQAGGGTRTFLVLAPRHPERAEELGRLLAAAGLRWRRRSALDAGGRPARAENGADAATAGTGQGALDVLLLDTVGELAALYRLAAACFVGGTLVSTGGHNPLEPARFGRAIAAGPSMHNFRDVAAQLDAAGAWRRVENGAELGAAWREWLDSPDAARSIGERARRVVEENRGALAHTLAVLAPLLERVTAAQAVPVAATAGETAPARAR
jgi:3-deoxy-D-manno-octulosonic-acid transferase